MLRHRSLAALAVTILAVAMSAGAVASATRTTGAETYDAECGSCHVAYPATMMSPFEWGQVLGRLDRHYGVDVSLDREPAEKVARYIRARPSGAARGATALPRITTQPWFLEEHDEIGAHLFRSAAVKSPSNCSACHLAADRGDFNEHAVRIPR